VGLWESLGREFQDLVRWVDAKAIGLHRLLGLIVFLSMRFRCIWLIPSIESGNRYHRSKFGFGQFRTEYSTEYSVFGLFGFGLGLFGIGFRSSVYMPTPSLKDADEQWWRHSGA
jgi:hypothetical protein